MDAHGQKQVIFHARLGMKKFQKAAPWVVTFPIGVTDGQIKPTWRQVLTRRSWRLESAESGWAVKIKKLNREGAKDAKGIWLFPVGVDRKGRNNLLGVVLSLRSWRP